MARRTARITPRCRFCGTAVDVFGDLCDDCFVDNDFTDDGVATLARACDAALNTLAVESTVYPAGEDA